MYHKVGKPRAPLAFLYVPTGLFETQMKELKANGFRTVPLNTDELAARGPKRIILTFDDGYENAFKLATPILARHGFRAIQFVVSGRIGGKNDWDLAKGILQEPLMDREQIRDWLAAGHQIGAHTVNHASLTNLPREEAREEISASKKMLEDEFGIPIEHFCYPYGDCNDEVAGLVEEAGFLTAVSTRYGVNHPKTPRYEIRRIIARYRTRNLRSVLGSALRVLKRQTKRR